jgi:hypothetical protein
MDNASLEDIKDVYIERREVRRKFNYLTVDNRWNVEGLLEQFSEQDGDKMFFCEQSKRPLFYMTGNNIKVLLEPCGYCTENKKLYHADYLWLGNDVTRMSFPVFFEGAISLEARKTPLTQDELISIQKEHGL